MDHPAALGDPIFNNTPRVRAAPESISQLVDRHIARTDIPRIRFHDYPDIRVIPTSVCEPLGRKVIGLVMSG